MLLLRLPRLRTLQLRPTLQTLPQRLTSPLLTELNAMLAQLHTRPARVLFRLAIEETESWFIADTAAIQKADPKAKVAGLRKLQLDTVVGAWERLAESMGSTRSSGTDKRRWTEHAGRARWPCGYLRAISQ